MSSEITFFADEKKKHFLMYMGIFFLISPCVGVLLTSYPLSKILPAFLIIFLFTAIPAAYFIINAKNLSKRPIIKINSTSIFIHQPFSRPATIEFSQIKSIKKSSNNGINIKLGLLKGFRINAGILTEPDREKLWQMLNEKIHP